MSTGRPREAGSPEEPSIARDRVVLATGGAELVVEVAELVEVSEREEIVGLINVVVEDGGGAAALEERTCWAICITGLIVDAFGSLESDVNGMGVSENTERDG
jgi:hypothetical protein